MDDQQLKKLNKEINISYDQILREEAEIEILNRLASNKLSANLIFYGGTALRLAYGSPRFSEDIDLILVKSIDFLDFKKFVQKIAQENNWQLSDIKNKRSTMFALLLIQEKRLKHAFSIKIEIHKPAKKVKIKTELSLIKSPLSILEPLLLVPTIQELKKLKESALMGRKKARDIFDLWYIAKLLRENLNLTQELPKYSKTEFKNELQVFLPKKYYPIINQLYEQISSKN